MKIRSFFKVFSIPKSIYYNLRLFPFKTAIHIPVFFDRRVCFKGIRRGCVELPADIKRFMIRVGFDDVQGISKRNKTFLIVGKKAKIVFKGECGLARGACIRNGEGIITFGENVYCNADLTIICSKSVSIGKDTIIGWDVSIRDCDGHNIYEDNLLSNQASPVSIGQHCWICQDVKILKGVSIGNDNIIAMNTCLTKSVLTVNSIIGGYPAKIIKNGVLWSE